MAYATTDDVQSRMTRELSSEELTVCETLLEDAAIIIDAFSPNAPANAKSVVSCRMVMRTLGDGTDTGIPMGATQGSASALGYSQSWTMGSGGGSGEMYLSKLDKQLLGIGRKIGSYSPAQELVPGPCCEAAPEAEA